MTTPARDDVAKGMPLWMEFPILVVVALVLALIIKTFLVQAFYIPSASMENTLQGGNPSGAPGTSPGHPYDRVLVNKLAYDFSSPHRGDVVVFKGPPGWPDESDFTTPTNPVSRVLHDIGAAIGLAPSTSSDFVKRVIGVGGDTVSCKGDVLRVNGHALTEPFLYPGSHPCSADNFEGKTVRVPKGELFVMGDHRDNSEDSRVNGPIPVSDVIGRAFVVIWPVSQWRTLPVPSTFGQPGLATASGHTGWYVLGLIVLAVLLLIVVIAVVRRRRRAPPTYAAGDG
ncbi:MAG TPA: signal peptidase I [Mycobacteriales bacterium]|nr:signal peptidase I [Mycobacteriales bacterium]